MKRVIPDTDTSLYGSETRGEKLRKTATLITNLGKWDYLSPQKEDRIIVSIYDLKIETGTVISPIVWHTRIGKRSKGGLSFKNESQYSIMMNKRVRQNIVQYK